MSFSNLDFDSFQLLAGKACAALEIHVPNPPAFRGELGMVVAGDIQMLHVHAAEHSATRTTTAISRAEQGLLKLAVIEQGEAAVVQDGCEAVLHAGDIAVYDPDRPYSFLFGQNARMSVLVFPRVMLTMPEVLLRSVTLQPLNRRPELTAMVGQFISRLARYGNEFNALELRRLSRLAVNMAGALLDANGRNLSGGPRTPDSLMERITGYIDEHLKSPELGPSRIASAHFMSVRALHALFAQHGTSVASTIRTRRLTRCYESLLDPRAGRQSITAIAADNGFVAAAHFSRVFRAHYGCTPSEVLNSREPQRRTSNDFDLPKMSA